MRQRRVGPRSAIGRDTAADVVRRRLPACRLVELAKVAGPPVTNAGGAASPPAEEHYDAADDGELTGDSGRHGVAALRIGADAGFSIGVEQTRTVRTTRITRGRIGRRRPKPRREGQMRRRANGPPVAPSTTRQQSRERGAGPRDAHCRL